MVSMPITGMILYNRFFWTVCGTPFKEYDHIRSAAHGINHHLASL
jgi:hypothetical protein